MSMILLFSYLNSNNLWGWSDNGFLCDFNYGFDEIICHYIELISIYNAFDWDKLALYLKKVAKIMEFNKLSTWWNFICIVNFMKLIVILKQNSVLCRCQKTSLFDKLPINSVIIILSLQIDKTTHI